MGKTHDPRDDTIKSDGTPAGSLERYAMGLLRDHISRQFPREYTIAEEDKRSTDAMRRILATQGERQWTIDGLDGTGNRSMGTSSYGAMVAQREGDNILFSALFRPSEEVQRGDGFFWAAHGQGAWRWCRNHAAYERLRTAKEGELGRLTVMLEGSSKKFFDPPITELGKVITVRSSFSSVVAATTVVLGRASALVTVGNEPWDTWPAISLIEEAGGIVTDWHGNAWKPESCGNIVAAANRADHARIIEVLNASPKGGD